MPADRSYVDCTLSSQGLSMGQGQCIEAKKRGCPGTSLSARVKSKSGIFAAKVHLGNRHFWLSYDTRNGSKVLKQLGKVQRSITRLKGLEDLRLRLSS